jgi:hypothetical protein
MPARPIRCPALVLAALAVACAAAAPPFFEPKEGFYKARGPAVKVAWAVDRTELPEGEALTATLTVRGAANPHEVVRPDLRKLPEYSTRFEIEDVPGKPAAAGAKEVAFVYRLRPRTRDVTRLPTLEFWYDSGAAVGNPFQLIRVKGPALTVTAAPPKALPAPVPIDAPDRAFELVTGPPVLDREPFAAGPGAWLVLLAAGPLVAGGWVVAWRRLYPDAARLARLRRSRAARRAIDAVRRAGRSPDPAAVIAAAVLGYLRTRFPLPPGADTPAEVGAGLRAAGLPAEPVGAAVELLRRCDEARFAAASDTGPSLPAGAEALVLRLEELE